MSVIKDITVKVNGKFITTTVIIYGQKDDNEYTVPHECNKGTPLDSEEREYVRSSVEAKIPKIRTNNDYQEYSDDLESEDNFVEDNY